MASSYEIQEAIAAIIQTAAPNAVVKPRNILGKLRSGDWEMLRSAPVDGARIHGWMVTMEARPLTNPTHYEFSPRFTVMQFLEYRTGDDDSNSEQDFLNEQDAVTLAFNSPLADPLSFALPPSFEEMRITPELAGGKLVHIARATVVMAGLKLGC